MIFHLLDVPLLEIVIENPLLNTKYPSKGKAIAILDTGYEGFALLPRDVFNALKFNELQLEKRELIAANNIIESFGTYGVVKIDDVACEGFIETSNIDEIVLGVEFASNFRIIIDYCFKTIEVKSCF